MADPTLLLLHGLGATADVWSGLTARWPGSWIAPDLSGHGRASWKDRYSFGGYAAEVADLVPSDTPVIAVGHSMGGVVALTLASGWFGVNVVATVGIGIKVNWTDDELAGAAARAAKPPRMFATAREAAEMYLRVAGLTGLVDPDSELARNGIVSDSRNDRGDRGDRSDSDGWRLAYDPRTALVGAPAMPALVAVPPGRITLACGEHDAMVSADQLAEYVHEPVRLDGLGHNAHVEAPERILDLISVRTGTS